MPKAHGEIEFAALLPHFRRTPCGEFILRRCCPTFAFLTTCRTLRCKQLLGKNPKWNKQGWNLVLKTKRANNPWWNWVLRIENAKNPRWNWFLKTKHATWRYLNEKSRCEKSRSTFFIQMSLSGWKKSGAGSSPILAQQHQSTELTCFDTGAPWKPVKGKVLPI